MTFSCHFYSFIRATASNLLWHASAHAFDDAQQSEQAWYRPGWQHKAHSRVWDHYSASKSLSAFDRKCQSLRKQLVKAGESWSFDFSTPWDLNTMWFTMLAISVTEMWAVVWSEWIMASAGSDQPDGSNRAELSGLAFPGSGALNQSTELKQRVVGWQFGLITDKTHLTLALYQLWMEVAPALVKINKITRWFSVKRDLFCITGNIQKPGEQKVFSEMPEIGQKIISLLSRLPVWPPLR